MDKLSVNTIRFIIVLLSTALFLPFLGTTHLFDWDEINFAESAREMLLTHDYANVTIDFKPFYEKPPLFIWLQALAMYFFGVNEFSARLPNALIGVFTLLLCFNFGLRLKDKLFGLLWAFFMLGSLLPFLYFKSGIIDPLFNLLIFTSLWLYYWFNEQNMPQRQYMAGIVLGLAVLTKGPVAWLLAGITIVIAYGLKLFKKPHNTAFLRFLVSSLLVGSSWYTYQVYANGLSFVGEFIQYQLRLLSTPDAGHEQPWFYHLAILLLGCFPASVLALPMLFGKKTKFDRLVLVLFWVVLGVFTLVKTKIVHYSSLCYLPLTFFAARYVQYNIAQHNHLPKAIKIIFVTLGVAIFTLLGFFPVVMHNASEIQSLLVGKLELVQLASAAPWPWYLGGPAMTIVALLLVFVFKRKVTLRSFLWFLPLCALVYFNIMLSYVPRIEAYSQGVIIRFLQEKSTNGYVEVLYNKSYAQYFYGNRGLNYPDVEQMLHGQTDKNCYFVVLKKNYVHYKDIVGLVVIKQENGFVFLEKLKN